MTLTPRILSLAAGATATEISIGFSLARSSTVTVRVFDRAGRLVRELGREQAFAGWNVVRWNGRDERGRLVDDGLFLVSVEGGGVSQVKTLAVRPLNRVSRGPRWATGEWLAKGGADPVVPFALPL
jgi:flagellar hook assembly protein FlgD